MFALEERVAASCGGAPSNAYMVLKRYDNLETDGGDYRSYRGLELSNGLKVLLISDPRAVDYSAAMNVNVGYTSDPDELPGLAHFCEHMVFQGTEKYPDENEFIELVGKHGSRSAFTSDESTEYYFVVTENHFKKTLDMFIHFFISPLFSESAIEREVQTVDSEFKDILMADNCRLWWIRNLFFRPGHDLQKFDVGNIETLRNIPKSKGVSIRDELLKFFETHYSSNRMSLCVIGNTGLQQLEQMVLNLPLHKIRNTNAEAKIYREHFWRPEELGRRVDVVPILDQHVLQIHFAVDDFSPFWKSQPGHFLIHLIRQKTKGSLYSELRRRRWAKFLWAAARSKCGFGEFFIKVILTSEGIGHVEEVLELVLNFIGMLKRSAPKKWKVEGLQQYQDLHAGSYACRLSERPFEDVAKNFKRRAFKRGLIEHFLDQFSPRNMIFFVSTKANAEMNGLEKDMYYGVEHRSSKLSEEQIRRFEEALLTPNEAFFLTEKRTRRRGEAKKGESEQQVPSLISKTDRTRVWWMQGYDRTGIYAFLTLPVAVSGPLAHFMARLFFECFSSETERELLDGQVTSEVEWDGFEIHLPSYHQKLCSSFTDFIEKLTSYVPGKQMFDVVKDNWIRELKNVELRRPYELTTHLMTCFTEAMFLPHQMLKASRDVTFERFCKFLPKMWSELHVEVLAYGKIGQEEVELLSRNLRRMIQDGSNSTRQFGEAIQSHLKIPEFVPYTYKHEIPIHTESCVDIFLKTGASTPRDDLLLHMVDKAMKGAAFNTFHTKEQLGYVAVTFRYPSKTGRIQGLRIVIQGSYDPEYVEGRIEVFLANFGKKLRSMSEEDFIECKEMAMSFIRGSEPKTTSDFWKLIKNGNLKCDLGKSGSEVPVKSKELVDKQQNDERTQCESITIEIIPMLCNMISCGFNYFLGLNETPTEPEKITKEDLIAFYDEKIHPNSSKRQKLCIRVRPKSKVKKNGDTEASKEIGGARTVGVVQVRPPAQSFAESSRKR
ncbi:hypothetical protein QR680_004788 [Steinernema hermaphroditum]|uniref:Peptidase M16 N-terminal domain-containing protein n=1 Tax=Steinernema hermaphroditum TaxID=289476 RepID=A0AA39LU88_9BILA|nr:hypothetical protein QR680_004788 [Steinernema hermaphroditum]